MNSIYDRRKELGLTLEQVGDMCNVGKSTVRKWENGLIDNMGRDKIVLLAKALQVSPLFILNCDTEKPLSNDEKLLSYYKRLNEIGKKKAEERLVELTYVPAYQKLEKHSDMIIAAHNDDEDPEQIALMEEDLKNLGDL